jgi:hypothetical protein
VWRLVIVTFLKYDDLLTLRRVSKDTKDVVSSLLFLEVFVLIAQPQYFDVLRTISLGQHSLNSVDRKRTVDRKRKRQRAEPRSFFLRSF